MSTRPIYNLKKYKILKNTLNTSSSSYSTDDNSTLDNYIPIRNRFVIEQIKIVDRNIVILIQQGELSIPRS